MKIHELKILPEYYHAVRTYKKTFEIRKNDRDFKVGDILYLKKYDPEEESIPKTSFKCDYYLKKEITYITDYAQKDGYVVMSIKDIN